MLHARELSLNRVGCGGGCDETHGMKGAKERSAYLRYESWESFSTTSNSSTSDKMALM